jgi:hypothetical protein
VYRVTRLLSEIRDVEGPYKMYQMNLMLVCTRELQLQGDSTVMQLALSVQ